MAQVALRRNHQQDSDGDRRATGQSEGHPRFRRSGEAWRATAPLRSGLVWRGTMVATGDLRIGADQVRKVYRRPLREEGFRPVAASVEKREGDSGFGPRGPN